MSGWSSVDVGPLAVLGAGTMGRGLAYVGAVAGAEVRLADLDRGQLDAALDAVERDLARGVERGKVTVDDAQRARRSIRTTTAIEDAADGAGVVIEAVVEQLDVKQAVLQEAGAVARADAIIATNTSAMAITEIAAGLDDPSRALGMHFFNPVASMKLCELVRGLATSEMTMDTAASVARALGKTPIRVEDRPGFATSRINALLGNEGMRMLEEGVASAEDIDTAVKLGLNHPMGPLEMGDLVGLDTRLRVLEYLHGRLGDRFRPTELHRQLVAAGRLGRKTGVGVYRYTPDGDRVPAADDPRSAGG